MADVDIRVVETQDAGEPGDLTIYIALLSNGGQLRLLAALLYSSFFWPCNNHIIYLSIYGEHKIMIMPILYTKLSKKRFH